MEVKINMSPRHDSPLRRWRRQHDVTQAELARRCGMPVRTISHYEQGVHTPRGEYLERLIEQTGLSADALVRPGRFLEENPGFLAKWADVPTRGRPFAPRKRQPRKERQGE